MAANIEELERVANIEGATIYNICHRNVGWGIQWHEMNKQQGEAWETGLVVYSYHETFEKMLEFESERLSK